MTVPQTMIAIEIAEPGGPEVLRAASRPTPTPATGDVLIQVAAAGVNRPDIMQRKGQYPPPPGASEFPDSRSPARSSRSGSASII